MGYRLSPPSTWAPESPKAREADTLSPAAPALCDTLPAAKTPDSSSR